MNGVPPDAHNKALEFVNQACTFTLIATLALLAWVASAVDFAIQDLRVATIACLLISSICGVASLSLVPLIQEARRPGQSNFEAQAHYSLFGRRSLRLKSVLLPQYVLLIAALILFAAGMID